MPINLFANVGKECVILKSEHSDIRANTKGVIKDYIPTHKGYAVEVTGEFIISGANQKRINSTEVVFSSIKDTKVLK